MGGIEKFTEGLSDGQATIMEALNAEILALPGMEMRERYKLPFYYGRSWICYLNPIGKEAVEIAFTRGIELSNMHGVLDFKNRKQIAGIECRQLDLVQLELIRDTLYEAIELDREVPYKHPRKRKKS